jgi:hypothetical protein
MFFSVGIQPMRLFLAGLIAVLIAGAVQAQTPDGTPTRIIGTVEKLDGSMLTVAAKDGQSMTVTMAPNAVIYGVEKRALADLKPGDFVASGGVKGTDGKIHAVELRIFPEALRGIGEGQRPWDVKPEGVMTNATVGTVSQSAEGGVVHVTYKGGESEYAVGPDVPIVAYVPGDTSLLKPGAAVLTTALKKPDGSLTTARITAEKDGVKPPM